MSGLVLPVPFDRLRDREEPTRTKGLFALDLLDDLVRYGPGDLSVGVELHRVHSATRGLRAQVTDVSEHLRQRNLCAYNLDASGVFHRLDLATTRVQLTDN